MEKLYKAVSNITYVTIGEKPEISGELIERAKDEFLRNKPIFDKLYQDTMTKLCVERLSMKEKVGVNYHVVSSLPIIWYDVNKKFNAQNRAIIKKEHSVLEFYVDYRKHDVEARFRKYPNVKFGISFKEV
jgi:hypothetical protein